MRLENPVSVATSVTFLSVSFEKVTPKLIPYFIGLIILLMLITFVPELSLGVPKLMGLI